MFQKSIYAPWERSMEKMILINECTKCPNLYLMDRHNSLCALKKNEQIKDTAVIPTWCPLPSSQLNKESTQEEMQYG
jgi:hypothetical protein